MPTLGIGLSPNLENRQRLEQTQTLTQTQQLGLSLLQKPILELRNELRAQLEQNVVIDEVVWDKEIPMSIALPQEHQSAGLSEKALDFSKEEKGQMDSMTVDDADRDQFLQNLENYEHSSENGSYDPEAAEKRQLFFDRQVKKETLREHLTQQLKFHDLTKDELETCKLLISSINDDGLFDGSLRDIEMVTKKSEKELVKLLQFISSFDPLGCGGRDLRETLLYQMSKLDDSPWEDEVRKLIDCHLPDLLTRQTGKICTSLGITPSELPKVLAELRKLSRKPGSGFSPSPSPEIYIEPEAYLKHLKNGEWKVFVPERNLPDIRISPRYIAMLENPQTPADVKQHLREKVAAAEALRDALADRQETIRKIAQTIVDHQLEYFETNDRAKLKPLTQEEVAKIVEMHNSTVSRTVNKKYLRTPSGIVELGSLFVSGLSSTTGGESISNVAVMENIRKLIENEDKKKPLSDQKISDLLEKSGIQCARRTVAKYRENLKIPGTAERKRL